MEKQMIQPNELRIGSILNYTTAEGEVFPTTIDWQDLKWISEDPKGFNLVHEPIPITEEKLLEFDFKVKYEENKKPIYTHKDLPNMELLYGDIGITNYMLFAHRWNITRDKGLQYLHELQNLFFSLTKQELIKK